MKRSEKTALIAVIVLVGLSLILVPLAVKKKKVNVSSSVNKPEIGPAAEQNDAVEIAHSDGSVEKYNLNRIGPPSNFTDGNEPGQFVDLSKALNNDKKTTVFYFHSNECEPCIKMDQCMQRLAQARPDIALVKIDIDRPNKEEPIDFHSPVAEQFEVRAVPSFRIFDGGSKLVIAKGSRAKDMIRVWYSQIQFQE